MTLWAIGRFDLGLSEQEFWRLTLRELAALLKRWRFDQERADWRAGMVASVIANIHRDRKRRSKPFTPQDFMPHQRRKKSGLQKTWQQQLRVVEMLNVAFGGKDLRDKTRRWSDAVNGNNR